MARPSWITNAGNLATLEEKVISEITLQASGENLTFSLIGGSLPPGMRIDSNKIVGTPFEVSKSTKYNFVIRAQNSEGAIDRTFDLIVEGEDPPLWVTPTGDLDIGPNGEYFILNRSPIDYQLSASDTDLQAGQSLEYYLDDLSGELPPGLSLSKSGRITGIIDAPLVLDYKATNSNYDRQEFDLFPYDFGGGTQEGEALPRYLNRFYEFEVTVSDGISKEKRTFRMFVINEQQLRTDTTQLTIDNLTISASATYLRAPIFLTTGNLGTRRANNFITIPLEVYDPNQYSGAVTYDIVALEDSTQSVLPPGLEIDATNGNLFGKVPYQPAVTQQFSFRVRATRTDPFNNETTENYRTFLIKILGEVDSTISFVTPELVGILKPNQASTLSIVATTTLVGADVRYRLSSGSLPPGCSLAGDGTIIGKVNQVAEVGVQKGLTTIDLGAYGLNSFLLDGGTTSIDKEYRFTVQARDYYLQSAVEKDFKIQVTADTVTQYSNIFLKPLFSKSSRTAFYNFITSDNVFPVRSIYRPNDVTFGLQKEMKMLLQHGIETTAIEKYVPGLVNNFARKTFKFGKIKSAEAKENNKVIYEVIYIELFDDLENNKGSVSDRVDIQKFGNKIETSQTKYKVSDNYITVDQLVEKFLYPNSTTNMQKKLQEIYPDNDSTLIKIDEGFLPLWMRSVQTATGNALGYTKAVPIAYVQPGSSISIIKNINESGFDFKSLHFDVDRLTIDSVEGQAGDKYIAFPKRKVI
jgi:hypothetical protein